MKTLKHHMTQAYPCGYLADKMARSEVVAPEHQIDTKTYSCLLQQGYRRSGHFVYRPHCDHCRACQSVRINVAAFSPNRSQRRSWNKHCHLIAKQRALHFNEKHFILYQRYQSARHAGGNMDENKRDQYQSFLLQSHVHSRLIEFYEKKQLRMVSFIDKLPEGLSSVYAFYDPDIPKTSFGTFNILWQIQQCQTLGLPYLYLGYWIKDHKKMSYKTNFQPLEILVENKWVPFEEFSSS